MDRRRAAGALLALAAFFACATAAPTASNQTALDLYDADSAEGCYYNFQHYGEGDRIMTNEPCLNCTCHNRMLMCYLRVCPFTKPIGQDCTVEKRADQCCPIVTCPDVPVDLLTSTPTTSPAEYGTTGVGRLDKYGCSINGKYFSEGAKVPPSPNKPCEHCYCIRNMTTCVMQECTLHVDGCTPIYHKEVCCPIRYSCDHQDDEVPMLDDMTTTVRPTPGFLLTTTTMASVTQIPQECVHDDQIFPDGALIKTEKACEHCYCMKGDIVCVVQECGTPMENEGKNCTSLAPREGQCCPDTYICEGDEAPTELPTEAPTELPTEVPTESMTEAQKEAITEIPLDDVTKEEKEAATEVPKELTTKIPVEETTEVQKELVTEKPEEEELEGPKESATELPEQTTTEAAMEVTTQAATETFTKAAAEAASDAATEGSGEAASESASEAATESASETATEYATQAATDAATERVTEAATEIATEKATEAGTEAATQAASEATTEKASQASSDASSEEPTTFVPPRRTSVEGSGYRNEPDELFTESPFLEHETEGSGEEEGTEKPSDADVTSVPIEEATSSVSDEESEATTAKESSLYIPSSTEPPTAYTEQPTTEPDKGENTVPSDDTTLPSIFDVPSSEAPVTIKASEESSPAIEQKTEIPSEDKQGEQPSSTTQETYTSVFTESSIVTTEAQTATTEPALIVEDKEVTVTPAESVTSKQPENAIIDKQGETISPTTEKEELDIQTSIPFDEKESKSTTVQLPDVPAVAETVKPEEATTETVQEYTTSENKIKDPDMYTTAQPAIEELQTTTTSKLDIPETTSINPLENEIHEEGPAILTPGIIPGEGNCLIDGITYNNDSAIPTSHKCQSSCRCVSSIVKCEELMCSPPPENMGDCQAVYESEETCCPYYTCKPVKDTPPLKPHSQMSGTELPIIQGDCDGELCNKRDEATPTTSVSPQCTSGDCSIETDKVDTEECGAAGCSGEPIPVLTPTKEEDVIQPVVCSGGECSSPPKDCTGESCQLPTRKHCGKNEPCAVFPQETCEGPNCADTTPVKEPTEHVKDNPPGCANPDDCKSSPDITKPSCEGEECTVIKQDCGSGKCENVPVEVTTTPDEQKEEACGVDGGCKKTDQSETPQPECTDETCIKKDVTVIEDKPSPVCTDESCVQKETTAPSSNIGPLSTELPELEDKPKTTVPGMETTEKRTELPETIETETERQTVSDAAVTEQVKIDTTAQPATEKQEVDTEMSETTSATHDNASQEPATEVISTKTPEITTETYRITELPESQEAEKTTAIPLTESQDSEASQTEPSVYGPTESPVTDKSQPETATTVPETEKEEPESIFTNAPLEVTSLETRIETTEPTVMDTTEPSKVDEEPSKPEVSESPEVPVAEKEEINTELPDALPTDSSKEPEDTEVTKLPEEAAVTESQEKEQSMAEEPVATERQPESPVTESQGDLITSDSKTPEQATEVPEADTDVKTEQPIEDELATKLPEVGTTSVPVSDEKDIITEAPKEPALESQERSTELPNVPIMDDKDNTESPEIGSSGITTAAPEKPASQDTSTETPELATTESHDIYTKIPEMPMTEEQVKQTVIPEDLVTESQDIEPTSADQEHTTPSVYPVTVSQAVTDGLREGAITEKELVPSEIPVTEVQEIVTSAPETTEENKTEQPTTEIEEVATETPEDKATLKPTNVPEEQSVESELPVSPEQQTVSTVAPIEPFPEDQEKPTEAPDANIPDSETKLPQFPSEPDTSTDDSVTSVTETQEIVTIAPEHSVQEDEKATESPATVSQATEKLDIPSEVPEVTTTEKEKAGTEIPEIVAPQEPEKQTEIPEILATESQEPAEVPSVQPTSEEEVPVTQPQDYVTETPKIPEEEIKSTVEVQELTTQVPEEQHIEPAATKAPEVDDKQTTVKDEMKQTEFEEPTEEPEIGTKTPENLDFQTEAPLAHVTEPQESGTSPVEQQNVKQDEPESPVTQSQETITESTEPVKSEDDKITDIPEAPEKEPQDSLSTTIAPLSEQDRQTEGPIVIEKEDAITQLPEIVKTEEPQQQTEIPESPVTESQQTATKTPETDELDVKTVTTESPIETTQKEFNSGEPDISTDGPLKPEDQEVYTNAPESPVTESQISSSEPATEQDIPIVPVTQSEGISTGAPESTVQQDIDRQTMVPESHVTEQQQITTEAPQQEDISTATPASPITESQEAFTNVPVVLVPGEQPTEQPAIEAQKPATNVPEIPPVQEESQTESPVEQPQESVVPEQPDVPEKPVIPEEKVTESPETITTQGITTDAPVPPVTEKQDIPVTESQDIATSVPDAATEEPNMQTLAPKLEYSETTPYLVELEEHTHKIEVETSTANPEDISVPQTTEVFEKPEETPTETEIEKQTEEPVTTEKSLEVSSIEPFTVAPTSSQEVVPTEAGLLDTKLGTDIDTSPPQEQSTPKSDVDDTKGTTLPEEVGEKVPETEQAVPMPILPVTEKEAEPTAQPEAETEKYTTAPPTDKPMEVTSSQEISSEEDFTPLRTTTVKSADETTTLAPSDKATTPEPKPTELPSPMSQETAKPTSSEEVPSEEDSGQFPPSGTGYGQEPDYAEEDQAFGPGTCRYGGKVYVSAQQIPRDDPCDFCFCFRSDIICLQQSCPPPIHGCHEEPIQGFCCPRYECPVSMATTLNMTTTTTTTTTTLPPHFLTHSYNGAAQKRGCLIKGNTYKVGEVVRASSGPCLHCTCGGDGQMKCDPKVCTPEPMLRQMIAAAVSAKRRR